MRVTFRVFYRRSGAIDIQYGFLGDSMDGQVASNLQPTRTCSLDPL